MYANRIQVPVPQGVGVQIPPRETRVACRHLLTLNRHLIHAALEPRQAEYAIPSSVVRYLDALEGGQATIEVACRLQLTALCRKALGASAHEARTLRASCDRHAAVSSDDQNVA